MQSLLVRASKDHAFIQRSWNGSWVAAAAEWTQAAKMAEYLASIFGTEKDK